MEALYGEKVAIEQYKRLTEEAFRLDDNTTAMLFNHIAKEELHHKEELEKRLKELGRKV